MSEATQDYSKDEATAIALAAAAESAHQAYYRAISEWAARPGKRPPAVQRAADNALRQHTAAISGLGKCRAPTLAAMRAKATALATDIGTTKWRQKYDPHVVLALGLALDILGADDFPTEKDYETRYSQPAA